MAQVKRGVTEVGTGGRRRISGMQSALLLAEMGSRSFSWNRAVQSAGISLSWTRLSDQFVWRLFHESYPPAFCPIYECRSMITSNSFLIPKW